MYFGKKKNKRYLFLGGNLILSHNEKPVAANVGSAVPTIKGGLIVQIRVAGRIRSTWAALRFIWGPSQALDHGTPRQPTVNVKKTKTPGISSTVEK